MTNPRAEQTLWLLQMKQIFVDARVEGQEVVLANALEEVTPTQAGRLLGRRAPERRT